MVRPAGPAEGGMMGPWAHSPRPTSHGLKGNNNKIV